MGRLQNRDRLQKLGYNTIMQVVLIILSVGLLGVIIYFAVSPKSSRPLKFAAIIGLALIGLSLGVCGILLIKGPGQGKAVVTLPFLLEDTPQPPAKKTNMAVILTFLVTFFFIMGLVLMTTMKEKQNKPAFPKKSPEKSADSHVRDATGDWGIEHQGGDEAGAEEGGGGDGEGDIEESFDIGI